MKHMSLSIITLHELKKSEFENELQLYLYLKVLYGEKKNLEKDEILKVSLLLTDLQ